ncbi:MAG: hypothetical protein KBA31_19765 [Alphaproteobacteria bacterium]|nr:hypothetical protein [Alphaproteobacteria bacterium]
MRFCRHTLAACAAVVAFAAAATAEARPDGMPRITLTEEPPPVIFGSVPNCGDPVPWRFALDPRSGAYVTPHDAVLHIPLALSVKNIGRQPAGESDGQYVSISQRPVRREPTTQLLRTRFRALGAGEVQMFFFEMLVPRGVAPGAWTVTATLDYARVSSFAPLAADCVMTNNKLSLRVNIPY